VRPALSKGPIIDPKELKIVCHKSALSFKIGLSRLRPELRCTLRTNSYKEHMSNIKHAKLIMTQPTILTQLTLGNPITLLGPQNIRAIVLIKKATAIIILLSHEFLIIRVVPKGIPIT